VLDVDPLTGAGKGYEPARPGANDALGHFTRAGVRLRLSIVW